MGDPRLDQMFARGRAQAERLPHPNYVPGLRSELERATTEPPPPDTDPAPGSATVRLAIGPALASFPAPEFERLVDWCFAIWIEADRARALAWLEGKRNG